MFIIWLLPVWGTGNKTRDLTVIWQLSKKKVFIALQRLSEKVKSKCKCAMLRKVQNFFKTKSSVSVQKKKKDQLSCSPHLKVKQPLLLIINAWALCRAWWNDIFCADCCSCEKALALAEFGRGIWSWSRLALSWKQRCVKDLFANWRGAIFTHRSSAQRIGHTCMPLVCDGSWFVWTQNFEDFCGHLVASQNFLAHHHQADEKLTFYGTEWLDIFLFWAAKPKIFCRRGHKFSDFVLAEWWALVPNLALAPGLVINCQIEWRFWAVSFLRTAGLKHLVIKNRGSQWG